MRKWVALSTALSIGIGGAAAAGDRRRQANHRGVLRDAEHPVIGPFRSIGQPVVFSASGQRQPEPAPLVFEHTDEIMAELGFSAAQIDELVAARVVLRPRQR